MRGWLGLVVFLVLVAAAAVLGAMAMPDAWYASLQKPSFNPPAWIFGPAWTLLYILMAVAAWRVFRVAGWGPAIGLWLIQLAVNASWSPLFFGMHRIDLALLTIIALDILVIATIAVFFRKDRIAAWLMLPYLAWIAFATTLNATIWQLNPA
ncbi:MAG: TspO/MBR family protein [Dokdonella sp.]